MERSDKQKKTAKDLKLVDDSDQHSAGDGALPRGWDLERVVEALIREKGITLSQAVRAAQDVEAEFCHLGISQVDEKLIVELVETKLIELGIKDKPIVEAGEDSFFDHGKIPVSENAMRVLERRYLKKDLDGKPLERPEEMFMRVAAEIARADLRYEPDLDIKATEKEFYDLMANLEFMPNSPTLMNAGRELGQLSACFVLPVEDSMESIFESLKNAALIHQSGGGTGFSFSRVRPKNDVVNSTRGVSSGPVSFMTVYNAATETIKQGGTRRGANMGVLRIDHPDIVDFIKSKEKKGNLTNFNISVGLTEDFMKAVEMDETYALVNPRTGEEFSRLRAKDVFDMIVERAHKNGEPGIVFLDRLNRDNPTPKIGNIESTNPCGEQPLLPYESCNLGSINLDKVVKDGVIDFDHLRRIVWSAVHFLDNVIDMNKYPLTKIREITLANRKIGLGVMGFADMLIKLDIPYNTQLAVDTAEKVMSFIQREARLASEALTEKRGPFPNFDQSIFAGDGRPKLRNATLTTIAPTGTISIIAGASSGIEPLFAISYIRNVMDNDELIEVNPLFEQIAKERGFYSEALMRKIASQGHVQDIEEVPSDISRVFITAHETTPEWHIRMQAAFQKYTDNAVSKTVNFPTDATIDDIARAYHLAWRLGCKGVTVYRDKSRDEQVLNIESVNRDAEMDPRSATELEAPGRQANRMAPRHRKDVIRGTTRRMKTGCGNLYVTINEDDEGLFEIFTAMGKAGGCAASQAEATSRLISLALRAGVETESILRQIRGISCPAPAWENGEMIMSCSDGIAKAIERYMAETSENGKAVVEKVEAKAAQDSLRPVYHTPVPTGGPIPTQCPDCGSRLELGGGCAFCRGCGYYRCG